LQLEKAWRALFNKVFSSFFIWAISILIPKRKISRGSYQKRRRENFK